MNAERLIRLAAVASLALGLAAGPIAAVRAEQANLQFRKPNIAGRSTSRVESTPRATFREAAPSPAPTKVRRPVAAAATSSNVLRSPADQAETAATAQTLARPLAEAPPAARPASAPAAAAPARRIVEAVRPAAAPAATRSAAPPARRSAVPIIDSDVAQATFGYHGDACCEPECGICESACGCPEPVCGCAEPACGCAEPTCGVYEPGCGIGDTCCEPACGVGDACCDPCCGTPEATCGCAEPDCGMVSCGSCVGNPGPDYWCFPVCFPRFKELSVWGGVQGFKGPRDYLNGRTGESNFGFNEGINIGGRAPLVGLLFPQISYQLGYNAVQSQLDGTLLSADDRSQQFVTAGLFRRVRTGLQFGAVWDLMRDDLVTEEDFHQLRYEIGLKGAEGREIGFWGASSTNNKVVGGVDYESVDQYCGFVRWHFRDGGAARIWGGGTGDREGIIGADFIAPLSTRWSIQGGFNYLIPDAIEGPDAARQESWNVGLGLVWHLGCVAKNTRNNPYAPLFPVANNGWMFIDQR